jgi:catechol 2,3-dioxygenase-like lactoylglutathione lyase family enzyme
LYTEDPDATRAFLRDVAGLPAIDTGGGWLIFKTGPSELGAHPSSWEHGGVTGSTDQVFDVSLMCDDLDATIAELTAKGAEFEGEPARQSWGLTAKVRIPGSTHTLTVYQPTYDPPAFAD